MRRKFLGFAVTGLALMMLPGVGRATTRDIAELQPARLTFDQSILNQLTYDTYRDPYDELQSRPYNLLFANIGRYPNLSPWQGQSGNYTRYLNALIGNNGTANVDNNADSIQGSLIRRETPRLAWGLSASVLAGNDSSDDSSGTITFSDTDDLSGVDVRLAAALQVSDRRVLGAGVRLTQATTEETSSSFEPGVGGFYGADAFDQFALSVDFGMRQFISSTESWETQVVVGFGGSEQLEFSENVDDTGTVTDRFVVNNFDLTDLDIALHGGYNRLRADKIGETQYRASLERSQRELDNADLSFLDAAGVITPNTTLLNQDAVTMTRLRLSAQTVFPAGETEVFTGAELIYSMTDGSTQIDAGGLLVNEAIDDTDLRTGLTVGVRQSLLRDKLRFVVSGRADLIARESNTIFDTSSDGDDSTLTTSQYAIGLEGVLANITLDVAWLTGEEAPVVPVPLGLPQGSRRTIEVDRLVFSAAVAW